MGVLGHALFSCGTFERSANHPSSIKFEKEKRINLKQLLTTVVSVLAAQ